MPSRRAWNCETLGCHVVVAAAAVAGAADDDLCGGEEGDGGSSVESRDDTYCVNHFQKFGISHLVYDGRPPRLKNPRHTVPMHIGYRLSCVAYGLETYDLACLKDVTYASRSLAFPTDLHGWTSGASAAFLFLFQREWNQQLSSTQIPYPDCS